MVRKVLVSTIVFAALALAGVYWALSSQQSHAPQVQQEVSGSKVSNNVVSERGLESTSSPEVTLNSNQYVESFLESTSIKGIDAATLSYIDSAVVGFYKDKNRVYYEDVLSEVTSEAIEGADPDTFEVVGALKLDNRNIGYAKDANHVYAARCGMKACYVDTLLKSRPADCTKDTLAQCEVR